MSGPLGRLVAKGKKNTPMEGEYVNIGTVWQQFENADQIRLQNRAKSDSGQWDNYPVRVVVTMPDGTEVTVTDEDFFINYKHAEDNF